MKTSKLFLILGLLAAGTGWADTPVDKTVPVNPDATIIVSNIAGKTTVLTWTRSEVHVTGTLGEHVTGLKVSGDKSRMEFKVEYPEHGNHGFFNSGSSEIEVHVPENARLKVDGVSADIKVDGIKGNLSVNTVSGEVGAKGKSKEVTLHTVSGDVHAEFDGATLRFNSVSGDLTVKGAVGSVDGESVSGDMNITGGRLQSANFRSVSGDLTLTAELDKHGSLHMNSMSGDAMLYLPSNTSASIDFSSFSGSVHSSLANSYRGEGDQHFDIGDGGAEITVDTMSGDLIIRGQ